MYMSTYLYKSQNFVLSAIYLQKCNLHFLTGIHDVINYGTIQFQLHPRTCVHAFDKIYDSHVKCMQELDNVLTSLKRACTEYSALV